MNLEQVKKKFQDDRDTFLKGRTRYASSFPYEFADYMTKYADPMVLKRWEEEQGIREKPRKRKALSFYAIQYGGVPMTPAGRERFIRMAKQEGGYSDDEIRIYLGEKPQFNRKEAVAIAEGTRNWCHANRDKILSEIDKEMQDLNSGCEQQVCPMSNLEKGKYEALRKLKEFIEGLQW